MSNPRVVEAMMQIQQGMQQLQQEAPSLLPGARLAASLLPSSFPCRTQLGLNLKRRDKCMVSTARTTVILRVWPTVLNLGCPLTRSSHDGIWFFCLANKFE